MQATVMGIETYYEQFGDKGSPVLVLHGWGGDVGTMLPVIDRLKKFHRVTAVDFPAHGGTGMFKGDFGVPEYAAWTREFISTLNMGKCHVVAHSFGGRVAVYLAANHPELFDFLVLTGCAGLMKPRTPRDKRKAARYKIGRAVLGFLSRVPFIKRPAAKWLSAYRDRHNAPDYKALSLEMRASFNLIIKQSLRAFLPRIKMKTLLIWGEKDNETPLWMADVFHREIAGSSLSIMPGGHFCFADYPDVFCDYALDFFEESEKA